MADDGEGPTIPAPPPRLFGSMSNFVEGPFLKNLAVFENSHELIFNTYTLLDSIVGVPLFPIFSDKG